MMEDRAGHEPGISARGADYKMGNVKPSECPRCRGLVVPDRLYRDETHCLICGDRWFHSRYIGTKATSDVLRQALRLMGNPTRVRLVDTYQQLRSKKGGWSWGQVQQTLEARGYEVKKESRPNTKAGALVAVRRRGPSSSGRR